jgi:hypothetical protein
MALGPREAMLGRQSIIRRPQEHHMRPAAFFAGTLVALGLYVAVAAALAFTPAWIGLGSLAIATVAAVSLVAGERTLPAR